VKKNIQNFQRKSFIGVYATNSQKIVGKAYRIGVGKHFLFTLHGAALTSP
jgi:hypothetical protein